MHLNFNIRVKEGAGEIGQKLLRILKQEVFTVLNAAKPPILQKTREIVQNRFQQSPEWQQLLGQTRGWADDVSLIEKALVESVRIEDQSLKTTANAITGGFTIYISQDRFTNVLQHIFQLEPEVVDFLNILILGKQNYVLSSYEFGFAESFRKNRFVDEAQAEQVIDNTLQYVFAGIEDELTSIIVQQISQRIR